MPRKQPIAPRRRPTPPPAPPPAPDATGEPPHELDLADRRDHPAESHANVGPDDRAAGHYDDIEGEAPERDPDVDAAVVEVARHGDVP